MPDLSILIPVLGRGHLIAPLLDDIAIATPCDYEVVFIGTNGDQNGAEALAQVIMAKEHRIKVYALEPNARGDYAKKINFAYRKTKSPHLFLGATDLHFHEGWYENAVRHLDPGIGVIGTNDLGNGRVMRGEHSTHSLVTREYADEFGTIDERRKILYEGYWHEYVDDEFVQTAISRDAFKFAYRSRVEHMHPWWGKAPTDQMYKMMAKRCDDGVPIYAERQKLWKSTS